MKLGSTWLMFLAKDSKIKIPDTEAKVKHFEKQYKNYTNSVDSKVYK